MIYKHTCLALSVLIKILSVIMKIRSSLRIESSAIINLGGVSTKLNKYIVFTMQTYKKLTNKQLYRHSNTSLTVTMSEIAVLFVIVPLLTNLPNMTDLALRNKYFANIFLAYRLATQSYFTCIVIHSIC